jgi:hypothetical protein
VLRGVVCGEACLQRASSNVDNNRVRVVVHT